MCLIGAPYIVAYAVYKKNGKPMGEWELEWLFSTDERRSLWLMSAGERIPELKELAGSIGRDKYNRMETANYAIQNYSLDYPLRCH